MIVDCDNGEERGGGTKGEREEGEKGGKGGSEKGSNKSEEWAKSFATSDLGRKRGGR